MSDDTGSSGTRSAPEVTRVMSPSQVVDLPLTPAVHDGSTIDRYVIVERIGAGNMGAVYLAYDPELARRVALKLMLPPRRTPSFMARFRREARAIAQLNHPNVVAIYDVGELGSEMYVAMEYVEGQSLLDWMRTAGHSLEHTLDVFRQAALGLAAAHDRGLVHRDFKPANVLLGRDGRVRVADFGLARRHDEADTASPAAESEAILSVDLTESNTLVGTPRYMAPEQHAALEVDGRADQFAFCVCLYEALLRRRPFGGRDYTALAENVMAGRVRPIRDPSMPAWLRELIMRGLLPDPRDRFDDMHALLAELTADRRAAREAALDGSSSTEPMFAAFPPPDRGEVVVELAQLRQRLERAWQLKAAGDYSSAIDVARAVADRSHRVAYLPLRAAALYTLGNLQHRVGDSNTARDTLYLAAQVAASAADDWQVANVWVFLVGVLGALERFAEADAIGRVAEAAINRVGDNPSLRSRLYSNRGRVWLAAERHDDAVEQFELAIELDERTHGPEHPFLVISLVSLAESLAQLGHPDLSLHHLERALAICEAAAAKPGARPRPSHPWCLRVLGRVHLQRGERDRAVPRLRAAEQLWQQFDDRAADLQITRDLLAQC